MLIQGDLFDVLPTLEAESFQACVTDPPYGIGFMGKEWDTFRPEAGEARIVPNQQIASDNPNLKGRTRGPASSPSAVEYNRSLHGQRGFQAWTEKWAREVFRVLKPGAHLVVCGAPRSHHRMMSGLEDAGFEIRDCLAWIFGQGFPKSLNVGGGWGTALKPGHEPIALARKPFKGSLRENLIAHGCGALNIDGCRIEGMKPLMQAIEKSTDPQIFQTESARSIGMTDFGRWPANVLLDEDAAAMLDEQSGESDSRQSMRGAAPFGDGERYNGGGSLVDSLRGHDDSGGASRFFYVAKPSREERDLGCESLDVRQRDDSRKQGNPGGDNPRNRGLQPRGNFHPTVKPLALMRWLVRLVTPIGGRVLDPFGGSGTTGMACAAEGFDYVLIEKEPAYWPIIDARTSQIAPLFQQP